MEKIIVKKNQFLPWKRYLYIKTLKLQLLDP